LCFSINKGNKIKPSLSRIFKSLNNIYGIKRTNTDLTDLAEQGVLLLNRSLTVEENKPNSHYKYWCNFTIDIIKHINDNCDNICFLLYGNSAKELIEFIDETKHHILTDYHPSPLSRKDFNGKFKECNEYLQKINKQEIKWV
jgi:uracil-DNA glycosylase